MDAPKPIKRSNELVQLSRDHHEGLLLCWQIKTALSKDVDLIRIIKYICHFYDEDLCQHFEVEEKYLFPVLPQNNELRAKAEKQHTDLQDFIKIFNTNINIIQQTLIDFSILLTEHIRFEERELFPFIEKTVEPAKLKAVSDFLNSHLKNKELNWNDNFWINK